MWYVSRMRIVSATYARAHLPKLLDAASRGERITIARHKKPIAELGPSPKAQRPMPILGGVKGIRIVDRRWAEPMTKQEIEAMLGDRY
jgi:antitoxin (DNA-binding transcriptional repressor) of toxin-antitoxin stability system